MAPGEQVEVRLVCCHDAALAVGLVVLQIPDQSEEADFKLFAGCQKKNQSTDAYYKVFTLTVDTINANGGMSGWHPKLFKIHREAMMAMQ